MTARIRLALLARTALGGAFVLAMVPATPAAAQVSSGAGATLNAGTVTGQFTGTGMGGASLDNTDANTSTVTLGSSRTILDWSGFNLASGKTLNFVFVGRGDIVLNRLSSGVATINGALNANIGSTSGAGGNVWFSAPGGIIFGSTAVVNVGGLLATTRDLTTGADFFDGDSSFSFTGAADTNNVTVDAGAQLNVNGGTLALIAPVVSMSGAVSDTSATKDSKVLYGAAEAYTITFAADADGDLDFLSWTVPSAALGSNSATPITISGTTAAGNVYLGAVSSYAPTAVINISGTVTANGAAASSDGNIILSAGGGVTSTGLGTSSGNATNVVVGGALTTNRNLVASAGRNIDFQNGADATAASNIILSAGDTIGGSSSVGTVLTAGSIDLTAADWGSGVLSAAVLQEASDLIIRDRDFFTTPDGLSAAGNLTVTAGFDLAIGSVSVADGITAGSNITLAAGQDLFLRGNVDATGDVVTLRAGGLGATASAVGRILQEEGIVTAATLTGRAGTSSGGSSATLNGANRVNKLGDFSATNIAFTNAQALTLTGTINGDTGGVALSTTGTLAVNSSTILTNGGPISLTGTGTSAIALSGSMLATDYGAITLTGATSLSGYNEVIAGHNTTTFNGTIDGAGNLTVGNAGQTVFNGAIGGTTRLGSLSVAGTTLLGTNTVRVSNSLSLGQTTIQSPATASTVTIDAGTGSVAFTGALNSDIGAQPLDITGSTISVQGVGSAGAFGSITFNGNTTLNGTYGTTGNFTVTGNTTLAGDATIFNGATGANFSGTVNADAAANNRALTIDAAATFGGVVGGSEALGSYTNASNATILNAGVTSFTTTGAQSFGGLSLGANTTLTGTSGSFAGGITGNGNDLTLNYSGTSAIDGTFVGIKNLTTGNGGTTTLSGTIATTGAQTYNDAVMLAGATTVASSGGGAITFGNIVDGAQALTVNTTGATTFGGAVGSSTPLTTLTTNAGGTTAINGGSITTTGAQSFGDGVTLGANTTLTGASGSFATVSGGARDLTLSYSGATAINGANFTGIRNLAVGNGGTTTLTGAINTTGTQTYSDAVTLSGATILTSSGAGAAGDITLGNTVDGAASLNINSSGTTTLNGMIGGTTALTSLATDSLGSTILAADVTTQFSVAFYDALNLAGSGTRTIKAGGASFASVSSVGGLAGFAVETTDTDITISGTTHAAEVALNSAMHVTTQSIAARDDIVIRARQSITTGDLLSGINVNGSAPIDTAGAADALAGATLSGQDIDVHAGTTNANGALQMIGAIRANGTGSDVRLNAFNGIGSGFEDLDVGAGGDIVLGRGAVGRDIALNAGGTITAAALGARDDIALRAVGSINAGPITSGVSVGSQAAGDNINGAADLLVGATIVGTDVDAVANGFVPGQVSAQNLGDVRINGGAAGIGSGAQDLDIRAMGNVLLTGAGGLRGRDVAVTAGSGSITTGDIRARDDVYLGAGSPGSLSVGSVTTGTTVDALASVDVAGAPDAFVGSTLAGNDLVAFGEAITATGQLRANGTGSDVRLTAGGAGLGSASTDLDIAAGGDTAITGTARGRNVILAAGNQVSATSVEVNGDYSLQAQNFGGGTLTPVFGPGGDDVTITDTAGGLPLGTLAVPGLLTVNVQNGGGLNVSGSLSSANEGINLSAAGIWLTGNLTTGTTQGVSLVATGNTINQPAGAIVTGTLSGSSVLSANLGDGAANNNVVSLGGFNSGGSFNYRDVNSFTVGGAITGGTGVTLAADAGSMTLAANINAAGQAVSLVASSGAVTQTGGVISAGTLGGFVSTDATLTQANQIDYLGGFVANSLSLTDVGGLAINGAVQTNIAEGDLTLRTTGGNLTIGLGGTLMGQNVALSTDSAFVNNAAGNPISTNVAGHWVIYAAAPAGNTYGGLNSNNQAIWNGTISSVAPDSVAGNRYVFAYQPTVTFTTVNASKVYGTDLTGATSGLYTVSGLHTGVAGAFLADTAARAYSGAPTITSAGLAERASVAGAPYTININGAGVTGLNGYAVAVTDGGQLTVTPKALTSTVTANNKMYDGTTAGSGSVSLGGVIAGDTVSTTAGTFTFADKNAGTGKTVSVGGVTLTGADAGNYTVVIPASAVANILQKALTATVSATSKVYDGTTAATGTVALNGVVGSDIVSATGTTYTFADKTAGAGKTVTVAGTALSGADAGNYTVTVPATALADILQKALTATVVANDKTYDGTTAATGTLGLAGIVAGDAVDVTAGLAFADKNAGAAKVVDVTGAALIGADASNYTIAVPATATASITPKALTATVAANPKTYDGTTAATGSVLLSGVVTADRVTTSGTTFAFADKNAGTSKTVNVTGTALAGADVGNYTLVVPASVLADILKRPITVTASNASKQAGQADPTLTYQVTSGSLVTGDSLTGALTRASGEAPGSYAIQQGSLVASANYTLIFVPGQLTILVAPPVPDQVPGADALLDISSFIKFQPGSAVNLGKAISERRVDEAFGCSNQSENCGALR